MGQSLTSQKLLLSFTKDNLQNHGRQSSPSRRELFYVTKEKAWCNGAKVESPREQGLSLWRTMFDVTKESVVFGEGQQILSRSKKHNFTKANVYRHEGLGSTSQRTSKTDEGKPLKPGCPELNITEDQVYCHKGQCWTLRQMKLNIAKHND